MASSRLDLIAPDLEAAVTPRVAREIAVMAIQTALLHHSFSDASLVAILQSLGSGDWTSARARRAEIERLATALDDRYLTAYETAGNQNTPEVIECFSRARAIASVAAALQPDETMGARDALYEAHASLGNGYAARLLNDVRLLLQRSPG